MVDIKDKTCSWKDKMKNDLPVVVIGQNYCTSLGIVKALGEAGYRVEIGKRVIATPRFLTPEMKSKYVGKAIYLHMGSDEEMIKAIIDNLAVPNSKKVLIPSDDFCVALIDRNFNELSRYFILPNSGNKQGCIEKIQDKKYQNEIAEKCGMMVTDSVMIEVMPNESVVIPDNTPFPCFIKPLTSVGNPKSYSQKCTDREELERSLSQVAKGGGCVMLVERFVEIEKEYTIPGISIGREIIIPSVIEKFRTGDGAHKGVTISGRVHKSDKIGEIVDKLKMFVGELGFQGIFDIELLQCRGQFFFNEINLRNGAAGYSLTKSGVNLPAIYVDYCVKSVKPQSPFFFKEGYTFVNEKAALENYIGGYSSLGTLLRTIGNTDIRFILSHDDIKACFRFLLLSLYLIGKKLLFRYH